jgi:hypothetical protein
MAEVQVGTAWVGAELNRQAFTAEQLLGQPLLGIDLDRPVLYQLNFLHVQVQYSSPQKQKAAGKLFSAFWPLYADANAILPYFRI